MSIFCHTRALPCSEARYAGLNKSKGRRLAKREHVYDNRFVACKLRCWDVAVGVAACNVKCSVSRDAVAFKVNEFSGIAWTAFVDDTSYSDQSISATNTNAA